MKIFFLISLIFSFSIVQSQESISLYYEIGSYKISKKNKHLLITTLNKLDKTKQYNVTIESSADYLGKKTSNFILSKKRAKLVMGFIKKNDTIFKEFKILNKGEISNSSKNLQGIQIDRKVKVSFSTIISSKFIKIKIGEKIVLKNIQFKNRKDIILKKSYSSLNNLVQFLKENPTIEIEIAGHVCCYAENLKPNIKPLKKLGEKLLSTRRAKKVYRYLVFKGINKNRMSYVGYGFQRPLVYPEITQEDKDRNKRVEIKIIKT